VKADDLATALIDYDLDDPDRVEELKPDRAWRIDHPSGQWMFAKRPIYDAASRRVERLEPASRLMTELHDAGQPWVPAKRNTRGQYITIAGDGLYQVTGFAVGTADWDTLTSGAIPDIGRAMGAYHRYQETSFDVTLPNFDFHELTMTGLGLRKDELDAFPGDRRPPANAIDDTIADFHTRDHRLSMLPSGLIHMDLSPGNVVVQDGALSAIIDFEAFPAPFLLDIGFAALYWATTFHADSSDTQIDRDKLRLLLSSYSTERSLIEDEKMALKDTLIWSAIRWWSRQAQHTAKKEDFRLHSRYDAYRCCLDLNEDWLRSCVE
jgi:Ser/Thr protein kinase RdoA (MazF antagonist)